MVNEEYIPKQRDIIYLDFSPTVGHEQKGKRPGLVISNYDFNKFCKLALVLPITSNDKPFPFHLKLENTKKVKGFILCEHMKAIDFKTRKITYIEKISSNQMDEVLDIIKGFLE